MDLSNLLLDTDYPFDKVIFKSQGSFTVANGDLGDQFSIPHSLPFTPLPRILWSNSSNFSTAYSVGDVAYYTNIDGTTGLNLGQSYTVTADATNVYINRYNNSGGNKTVYYRIFCFQPTTASDSALSSPTSANDNNFILNSDYNYLKLFKRGQLTTGSPSFTHALGYIPKVWLWSQVGSSVDSLVYSQVVFPPSSSTIEQGVTIDNNNLTWVSPGTAYDSVHYRIYL